MKWTASWPAGKLTSLVSTAQLVQASEQTSSVFANGLGGHGDREANELGSRKRSS